MQAQEGIENIKLNKLKPSSDGLADCKTTTRDVNLVIGLYSPYKYGIQNFEGYDITKFRNNIRFLEIIEDRDYGAGGYICPLLFNGAASCFHELPEPNDNVAIHHVYRYLEGIQNPVSRSSAHLSFNTKQLNNGSNNSNHRCKWGWKDYFNYYKSRWFI